MWLLDLFRKNKKEKVTATTLFKEEKDAVDTTCDTCKLNKLCDKNKRSYLCNFLVELEYNKDKPSILLFDDNPGIISFLEDDIKSIFEELNIKVEDYNILKFSTEFASFNLRSTLNFYGSLNIVFAIFDITIGGRVYDSKEGNIMLDGVDSFKDVKTLNPDLKYLFFTGNKLNQYIKKNKEIISKFKSFTNEHINSHILYKTSVSPESRRENIKKFIEEIESKRK